MAEDKLAKIAEQNRKMAEAQEKKGLTGGQILAVSGQINELKTALRKMKDARSDWKDHAKSVNDIELPNTWRGVRADDAKNHLSDAQGKTHGITDDMKYAIEAVETKIKELEAEKAAHASTMSVLDGIIAAATSMIRDLEK
ncbi:DUF5082 domain-containing protein [Weissella confusa]|uniref:YwqH-like family protein n=1 Tax=Weissella confusa TaxID=1583 RepID=UPI001C6FB889|nr:DUF5082 family protein [Weissella confusa]QYU58615.1 DUF5082 domain-containing protein [Weissella confusa]